MIRSSLVLSVIAVLVGGCGASEQARRAADGVHKLNEHVAELRAQAARVPGLQTTIKQLERRLLQLERMVGLAAFRSDEISTPTFASRTVKPRVSDVVEAYGQPAHKKNLAKHVAAYNGYVIVFWATWCVPCISDEELAHLRDLQRSLRRHNVELVSMAIDDLGKVLSHAKASKWLYPLWFRKDGHIEMMPRAMVEKVGVTLPLFLVVGPDGQIRYYRNKKLDTAAVRDIITATGSICRVSGR